MIDHIITDWGMIIAILVIGLFTHLRFWKWYYRRNLSVGEQQTVKGVSGLRLVLEKLPPRRTRKGVVLCCPGLACNGRIFHLDEDLSFARLLSRAGYETWVLHPRGFDASEQPKKSQRIYGFEAYREDAIRVSEWLNDKVGEPIFWLGHSMGGLVGYEVALSRPELLKGLITAGTPTDLSMHPVKRPFFWLFKFFGVGFKTAPLGKLSTLVAPWAGWFPLPQIFPLYVNFDLIKPVKLRKALAVCFEDVPRKLIIQFVHALEGRKSLSGQNWAERQRQLSTLEVPMLALMGNRDGLAPIQVTRRVSDLVPHELLTTKLFEGFAHCELVLGIGAEEQVFPTVLHWLNSQSHAPESTK